MQLQRGQGPQRKKRQWRNACIFGDCARCAPTCQDMPYEMRKMQVVLILVWVYAHALTIGSVAATVHCRQNQGRSCRSWEMSHPYINVPSKFHRHIDQQLLFNLTRFAVPIEAYVFMTPSVTSFNGSLWLISRLRIRRNADVSTTWEHCPQNSLYVDGPCPSTLIRHFSFITYTPLNTLMNVEN